VPPTSAPAPAAVHARDARLSLALLLAINLLNYIDRYILAAVEPLVARDVLGPNDPREQTKMGALATAFIVSYMASAPLFGWLGERVNRWAVIGVGVLLFSLASGLSGLSTAKAAWLASAGLGSASAYAVLLASRALVGVGEGAYGPLAPALISDLFPVERRGKVLAWFYVALPVGSALGFVLGGQVAARFGWRWAFYAVVGPGVLLGLLAMLRRDPPRGGADAVAPRRAFRLSDLGVLLRTPSYVLNVAGMAAMTFAIGGVSFWMPRYVAEFRGAAPLARANLVFGAITVVAGIAATLAGGWAGDRLRARIPGAYLLVSAAGMLAGFPLFLLVLVTPFPLCWGVIFLAVLCLFFNTGPSNTAIANVTHPSMRAFAYAACILVIHALGDAVSPVVIGFVSDTVRRPDGTGNMNAGFAVVSGAILLAGLLWLWASRHLAHDTALAPQRL
jgi:MFS family permease